jgi:hypothetical protein
VSALSAIFSEPLIERVGWALVHFLWQGALLAVLLAALLWLVRRRSANLRYFLCCGVLFLMAACPVATFLVLPAGEEAPAALPPAEPPLSALAMGPSPAPLPAPPLAMETAPVPAGPPAATPEQVAAGRPPTHWAERARGVVEANLGWVVAAWLAGVLVLSLRLAFGWHRVRRMRRSGSDAGCASCREIVAQLASRMKVSRPVQLLESAMAQAPVVIGWLKPVILLPASAVTGLTPEQLAAVLAHELAHVRRHDYAVNLAQTAVETVLFYHPAVHWVSHRIRAEREVCCDEVAVAACGDSLTYARALAELEGLRAGRRRLAIGISGGSLFKRIRRIVGVGTEREGFASRWTVLSVPLLLIVAAGLGLLVHRSRPGAPGSDSAGNSGIRLIGVRPDEGDDLFDADGTPIGELPDYASPDGAWGVSEMPRHFVFRLAESEEPMLFWGHWPVRTPDGRKLGGPSSAIQYSDKDGDVLLLKTRLPRTIERRLRFPPMGITQSVRTVDVVLNYWQGPRRAAAFSFKGPFEAGEPTPARGRPNCSLEPLPPRTYGIHGLVFRLRSSENFDVDKTPLLAYDRAGRRHLLRRWSGGWGGATGVDCEYFIEGLSLDEVAAITGGEVAHEAIFEDVVVSYPDREPRSHAAYLDEVAERLGLREADPEKLRHRSFAPGEGLAVVDVVRGRYLIERAVDAVVHEQAAELLSPEERARVLRAASQWMTASDDCIRFMAVQLGLWAGAEEYIDPAIELLGSPLNEVYRVSRALARDCPDALSPEQLARVGEALLRLGSWTARHDLLLLLRRRCEEPAALRALLKVAQADDVSLWWYAINAMAWERETREVLREQATRSEQFRRRVIAVPKGTGVLVTTEPEVRRADAWAATLLTGELLERDDHTFGEIRGALVHHSDRDLATLALLASTADILSEWGPADRPRYGSRPGAVRYAARQLNKWYGTDLGGIGAEGDWSETDPVEDWRSVAIEVVQWGESEGLIPAGASPEAAFSALARAVPRNRGEGQPPQARLPGGAIAELAALGDYPSEGARWWRPDGTAMEGPPPVVARRGSPGPDEGTDAPPPAGFRAVQAVLKLQNWSPEASSRYLQLAPGTPVSATGFITGVRGAAVHCSIFTVPTGAGSATASISLSPSPWTVVAESDGTRDVEVPHAKGTVSFSAAEATEEGVSISTVASGVPPDCRIALIRRGTSGRATVRSQSFHSMRRRTDQAGRVHLTMGFRDVSLDEVLSYQFLARPMYQVTFRKVSLEPGQETEVQVEVEPGEPIAAPSSPPEGAARRAGTTEPGPDWPEQLLDWPEENWVPVPVPGGWDRRRLLAALAEHLQSEAERLLPGCDVQVEPEMVTVAWHSHDYAVWVPSSKADGAPRERRTETGPLPDGLIVTVRLSDRIEQLVRPQPLDHGLWRVYAGHVRVPGPDLYLMVNVAYGPETDRAVLRELCAPTRWLKAIAAPSPAEAHRDDRRLFGPPVERTVQDDTTGSDMFLDLDTGRLLTPPLEVLANEDRLLPWAREAGADVMAESHVGLIGFDLVQIPDAEIAWDAEPQIVEMIGRLLELDHPRVEVVLDRRNLMPGREADRATYWFRTREGATGLLQIVGVSEDPKGLTVRYKMVRGSGLAKATDGAPTPADPESPNEEDGDGEGLIRAAREGDLAAIRALLQEDHGRADLNGVAAGPAALRGAVAGRHSEVVSLLLEHGVDPNARASGTGDTALHLAAKAWEPELCELLVEHGADVNARDESLATPLHCAAISPWNPSDALTETARVLVEHGADLFAVSRRSVTSGLEATPWGVARNQRLKAFLWERMEPTIREQEQEVRETICAFMEALVAGDTERLKPLTLRASPDYGAAWVTHALPSLAEKLREDYAVNPGVLSEVTDVAVDIGFAAARIEGPDENSGEFLVVKSLHDSDRWVVYAVGPETDRQDMLQAVAGHEYVFRARLRNAAVYERSGRIVGAIERGPLSGQVFGSELCISAHDGVLTLESRDTGPAGEMRVDVRPDVVVWWLACDLWPCRSLRLGPLSIGDGAVRFGREGQETTLVARGDTVRLETGGRSLDAAQVILALPGPRVREAGPGEFTPGSKAGQVLNDAVTSWPSPARDTLPGGTVAVPGAHVSFLGHEQGDRTGTYQWSVTPAVDMVLLFGLQDWRSAESVVARGASVRLQAGQPVELALQVREGEGMLRVECGAAGAAERPSLALAVPPRWTLGQAHAQGELHIGQRYYQTLWNGSVIEVSDHGTKSLRTIRFLVCGAPADSEGREFSPTSEWYGVLSTPAASPFVLYGQVTDTEGRPVPDVMVYVATGWGTLLGGGRAVTGADGRYRLPFGAGWHMERSEDAPMGIGVQAAAAGVRPPGFYEVNMCRQGDLLMAESRGLLEKEGGLYSSHLESGRFVLPDQPYELNFVVAPATRLTGRLVDPDGDPIAGQRIWVETELLPPASSVYAQTETAPDGGFAFDSLPVDSPVQIGLRHMAPGGPRHGVDIWAAPHTFDAPGPHDCTLTYDRAQGSLQLGTMP